MKNKKQIIAAIILILASIALFIYFKKSKADKATAEPESQSQKTKQGNGAKPYWKGNRETYDLQVKLNSLGENLVLDGINGAKTKEAAARHNLGFSNPNTVAPNYNLDLKQYLEAPANENEKFKMIIPNNSFFNI